VVAARISGRRREVLSVWVWSALAAGPGAGPRRDATRWPGFRNSTAV